MKQKIVLEVNMPCENLKKKARMIAALTKGMISMAIDMDRNQLVVVGVGIDAAILTTKLRRKVGSTTIISVEEVKSVDEKKEEKAKKKKKDDKESANNRNVSCSSYNYAPPLYPDYEVRYKIGCLPHI